MGSCVAVARGNIFSGAARTRFLQSECDEGLLMLVEELLVRVTRHARVKCRGSMAVVTLYPQTMGLGLGPTCEIVRAAFEVGPVSESVRHFFQLLPNSRQNWVSKLRTTVGTV